IYCTKAAGASLFFWEREGDPRGPPDYLESALREQATHGASVGRNRTAPMLPRGGGQSNGLGWQDGSWKQARRERAAALGGPAGTLAIVQARTFSMYPWVQLTSVNMGDILPIYGQAPPSEQAHRESRAVCRAARLAC